jgi:hypothetical protein
VSALGLALVTGRALLVDSAALHHVLLPPRGLAWHYSRLVGSDAVGPGLLSGDVDRLLDGAGYADLSSQNPAGLADVLCSRLDSRCRSDTAAGPCGDAALRAQFLYVRTDLHLLPALLHNPHAGPRLRRLLGLGPDGEGAFGLLARFAVRPRPHVARAVRDAFRRLAPAGPAAVLTVGMQVRRSAAVRQSPGRGPRTVGRDGGGGGRRSARKMNTRR